MDRVGAAGSGGPADANGPGTAAPASPDTPGSAPADEDDRGRLAPAASSLQGGYISDGVPVQVAVCDLRLPARPTTGLPASVVAGLRGVNVAGGEFEHTPAGLPGVVGVNYAFDPLSTFTQMRARGHDIVRIPFRWERIQHTLGGPLSEPGISELRAAVRRAGDAGLVVLLDMHNYGRYTRLDDTEVVLGAGIDDAHFGDVWRRLAQEFADEPAVVAWGLMNEPNALPTLPSTFLPAATVTSFASGTDGWRVGGSGNLGTAGLPGAAGEKALAATAVLPANSGNYSRIMRISSASSMAATPFPRGSTIQFTVHVPQSVPGAWRARAEIQDLSWTWRPSTTYAPVPKGELVTVRVDVPDELSGLDHKAIAVQLEVDGSDGSTPSIVHVGEVELGTVTGPGADTTTWKRASQTAVTAVRGTGDRRTIFVSGDRWGGTRNWPSKNGAPWIADPANNVVYEAHYYAAPDNAGAYTQSYAEVEADARRRGWTDLHARVRDEVDDFTDWLDAYGVHGFIGEVGWPHGPDAASWDAVGETIYDVLDAEGVGATYWATGTRWNPHYALAPYRYAPFGANSQAHVIERHPSAGRS